MTPPPWNPWKRRAPPHTTEAGPVARRRPMERTGAPPCQRRTRNGGTVPIKASPQQPHDSGQRTTHRTFLVPPTVGHTSPAAHRHPLTRHLSLRRRRRAHQPDLSRKHANAQPSAQRLNVVLVVSPLAAAQCTSQRSQRRRRTLASAHHRRDAHSNALDHLDRLLLGLGGSEGQGGVE
jgi:hypothetical protein